MISGVACSTKGARLHGCLACPAAAGSRLRPRLHATHIRTRGTITRGYPSHGFVLRACTVQDDLGPVRSRLVNLGKLGTRLKPYAELARLDKPIGRQNPSLYEFGRRISGADCRNVPCSGLAGTWLLLWPCLWSIALATPKGGPPNVGLVASFAIGALVWRSAGCTVNDLCDRNLDARVERTRSRPLPAGEVTVGQAQGRSLMRYASRISRDIIILPISLYSNLKWAAIQSIVIVKLPCFFPHVTAFLALQLIIGVSWFLSLTPLAKIIGLSSIGMVMAYPLMKRITYWPQVCVSSM